jgi:hypothetical protein
MASVGESRMDVETIHLEIAKGQCMKSSQCPLSGFPVELIIKIARAVEFATDDENEAEGFSTPSTSPVFDRPCPVRTAAPACMQRHPGHTGGSRSQIYLFPGTETTSLRPTVEWCNRISVALASTELLQGLLHDHMRSAGLNAAAIRAAPPAFGSWTRS